LVVFYCLFVLFLWYSLFVVATHYHNVHRSIVVDMLLLSFNLWTSFNVFFNYLMATATDPGTSYLNTSVELQQVLAL
jgi:cell division protein FtsW (lipid II flippase)